MSKVLWIGLFLGASVWLWAADKEDSHIKPDSELVTDMAPPQESKGSGPETLVYAVAVEGKILSQGESFVQKDKVLWISKFVLSHLRLDQTTQDYHDIDGEVYTKIDEISGLSYQIDTDKGLIDLHIDPKIYNKNILGKKEILRQDPQDSDFLFTTNYNVSHDVSSNKILGQWDFSPSISLPQDQGNIRFFESLKSDYQKNWDYRHQQIQWQKDFPKAHSSFALGDLVSPTGFRNEAFPFFGFRLYQNNKFDPDQRFSALPLIEGVAREKSLIKILIDGKLQQSFDVDIGPWAIYRPAIASGYQEITLVTVTEQGQETRQSFPYYGASKIKAPGKIDYQFQGGFVKGKNSMSFPRYQRPFISGGFSYGLNSYVTTGLRVEEAGNYHQLGMQNVYKIGLFGLIDQQSHLSWGEGHQLGFSGLLSYEFARNPISFSTALVYQDRHYKKLGADDLPVSQKKISSKNSLRWNSPVLGNIAVLLDVGFEGPFSRQETSLSWQKKMGKDWNLSAQYNHGYDTGLGTKTKIFLGNLSYALPGGSLELQGSYSPQEQYIGLVWNKALGGGDRFKTMTRYKSQDWWQDYTYSHARNKFGIQDWNLKGNFSYTQPADQSLFARHGVYASYSESQTQASWAKGLWAVQNTLKGSVGLVGHKFFMGPYLSDEFAVIELNKNMQVPVLNSNKPLGTTSKSGILVIPQLHPGAEQVISLDHEKIPLDYSIDEAEAKLNPLSGGAYRLQFKFKERREGEITIVMPDKSFPDVSSVIKDLQGKELGLVGAQGRAFLSDLPEGLIKLQVHSYLKTCSLDFSVPAKISDSNLGTFVCQPDMPSKAVV